MREEIDPEQEEAIVYQNDEKKTAYPYVKLISNVDDHEVELLKNGELPE